MARKKPVRLSGTDKDKIYKLFIENNFTKQELANNFNCTLSVVKNIIANYNSPLYLQRIQANKSGKKEPICFANETWKQVSYPTKTKYEVSNLGRVRSYFIDKEKPAIIKGVLQQGYVFLDYFNTAEKRRLKVPFHLLVADHFLKKSSASHKHVIHLDFKKGNNVAKNLKWVTEAEMYEHNNSNTAAIAAREKIHAGRTKGAKLTLVEVERIRRLLSDPLKKTTKTRIAAMYGVTPMTIYRIQSGEIWGTKGTHVTYERKSYAKLDEATIKKIRSKLKQNGAVQANIAKEFGLSPTLISRLKNGKTYKN